MKTALPLKLDERFEAGRVDAAKGVLILLVIVGHASNFWSPEAFATFSIKFFHVACFLLLPFIYDVRPITLEYFKERMARYYIPFAAFLIGYALLYLLMIRGIDEIGRWLYDLGRALAFGNAPMLDRASGLQALWFMPALVSVVCLNAWLIGRVKLPLWALLIGGLAVHVSVGLIDAPYKFWAPFGLVVAGYLLWLGVLIRFICSAVPKEKLERFSWAFLGLAIFGIVCAGHFGTLIKFPVMALPDILDWKALLIHDVIIVSMFLFLITTRIFENFKALRWCGQNSLTLYLTHLLFLAGCMEVATEIFETDSVNYMSAVIVAWIFIMALSGGIVCAIVLNKWSALKRWIMPRSWAEWPPVRGIKK